MKKGKYRQLFDSHQIAVGDLRAKIMKLEKRPKWTFWLWFTCKTNYLNKLRIELAQIEMAVNELRNKAIVEYKQVNYSH